MFWFQGIQLGPTEASRYWIYWVPAQYVDAIKDTVLGKWQYFWKWIPVWNIKTKISDVMTMTMTMLFSCNLMLHSYISTRKWVLGLKYECLDFLLSLSYDGINGFMFDKCLLNSPKIVIPQYPKCMCFDRNNNKMTEKYVIGPNKKYVCFSEETKKHTLFCLA